MTILTLDSFEHSLLCNGLKNQFYTCMEDDIQEASCDIFGDIKWSNIWRSIINGSGCSRQFYKSYDRQTILQQVQSNFLFGTLPDFMCRYIYQDLVNAMYKFDPDILQSQNQGWKGVVEYYQTNGGPTDPWGGNPSKWLNFTL